MAASILEHQVEIPVSHRHPDLLAYFRHYITAYLHPPSIPIRFVITSATPSTYFCELATLDLTSTSALPLPSSIFEFRRRQLPSTSNFNVALMIPTGIGAELGGHAGDAGPVACLLAQVCDTLLLHPNVVNASDLNELPSTAWYVEGSVLTRLLMGTVGLSPVRMNRVLVIVDAHPDAFFVHAAVNTVSAARASYGLSCPEVVCLAPPVTLRSAYSPSGRAARCIENLDVLFRLLADRSGQYDAVALSSVIAVPPEYHQGYFDSGGDMVNPWGGVEAMLTHALSSVLDVPTAHSPMFESRDVANRDPGIVDPRMAAEAVSTTFLQCTLKGLQRSPRILVDHTGYLPSNVITASEIASLVIPDGCLGIPTLAALYQDIPVIAVANNNIMAVDLAALPWGPGQFYRVNNYYEAAGLLAAMRAGLAPDSIHRPLLPTRVSRYSDGNVQQTPRGTTLRQPSGELPTTAAGRAAK